MSRLIDADELKSKIRKSNCNFEYLWKRVVLDVIDNCKTAYNVDEVVKKLYNYDTCTDICMDKHCCYSCKDLVIHRDDAVEIVERGGIDEW